VRLGLVVPRYGEAVLGGTEHWLRQLCEHLVDSASWDVDVFTTCAVSAATWASELPAGTTEERGVRVHRHRSRSGRRVEYLAMANAMAPDPSVVPDAVAERYIDTVGPVCPDVIDDAARSDCDLVAVTPYLFWPAVAAVRRLGRRVIFHCAAHDELELHLPLMHSVFGAVGGFAFNSHAERDLVHGLFDVTGIPAAVVGNAVADGAGSPERARRALGLAPTEPFVLCVSRVERTKGVHALADLWRLYRQRRPHAPRLVVMGPAHEPLASDGDVIVTGPQPEEVKWGALRASAFLVNPSSWESFSLVVVEAMLAGRPVLVNARCAATVEHCRRSRGGLWFSEYADFETAVDHLLGDEEVRARLGGRGEAYARREFSWDTVLSRYISLVESVVHTRGTSRESMASAAATAE